MPPASHTAQGLESTDAPSTGVIRAAGDPPADALGESRGGAFARSDKRQARAAPPAFGSPAARGRGVIRRIG